MFCHFENDEQFFLFEKSFFLCPALQCQGLLLLMFHSRVRVLFASLRKMSATSAPLSAAVLSRLQLKSAEAEKLLELLTSQISGLQKTAVDRACKIQEERLRVENEKLRQDVERLKSHLVQIEIRNGVKQVPTPSSATVRAATQVTSIGSATGAALSAVDRDNLSTENVKSSKKPGKRVVAKLDESIKHPAATPDAKQPPAISESKKAAAAAGKKPEDDTKAEGGKKPAEGGKGGTVAAGGPSQGGEKIDASRLNMRIGFIVSAKRHPDADSLYVEEVDVGEGKPRTIVSGLVKHVPLEQMQQRYAVFLLNLKPAKMRGILSEGMIMCASTPEKVEIINPPEGVTPGQRVVVDNYQGDADDQLNPKKKIWEQIQPDLRINGEGAATYKGSLWRIEGQPTTTFKAASLVDVPIK